MTDISHSGVTTRERGRKAELWEFRALVVATYPLFLATTVVRRATGSGRGGGRSAFAEARAAASAAVAFAFMG